MADVQLSVELQAQVDKFVANLLSAANGADNTSNSVSQMSTNISRNIANVNKQNLSQFTAALNAGTLAVKKFNDAPIKPKPLDPKPVIVGVNQAANALTNLGRVAQDAPFGFIGIQNNLNPLLESFQRLRAETGSNKAAFSALTSSLLGPAGLGVALSIVSAGILLYQQYQQKAKREDEEKEKAQRKLIDANETYFKSLSAVERASVKGEQDAQKEIISLQNLYFAARNVKLSTDERYKAAKELQDQYPQTFKNFSQEEIALGKASNAYKGLAEDIFAVARAAAATDIITENTRKLTLEQLKYNKTRKELDKIEAQIASRPQQDNRAVGSAGIGASSAANINTKETNDLLARQSTLQSELNASQKTKTSLVKENLDVEKLITSEVLKQGVVVLTGIDKTKDKVEKTKKQLAKGNTNILGDIFDIGNIAPSSQEFTIQPRLKIEPIVTGLSELQAEADKWNEKFTKTIESGITGTLSGIGNSIGEALATGGSVLNAIGSEILIGFGNFLSKFGDLLIEYGAAAVLKGQLDLAIATPGLGIAAGFAAIAAGIALKVVAGAIGSFASGGKASKGVTAFANGGIISGPTLGLMGEYAGAKSDPEVVAPLSKLKNLLGETDNAGNVINKNVNEPVVIVSETTIKGNDLVTVFNRANASRNRQG